MALVGLVTGAEIGVDIEYRKPMPDCEQISERFFSASERQVLRGIPGPRKEEAFFNCWTRKEAYLKATGDGLTALDGVTVGVGERAAILALDGDDPRAWTMRAVEAGDGLVGAVAVGGAHPALQPVIEAAPWN
jgi:4'-phosphopantetheinyl transferase